MGIHSWFHSSSSSSSLVVLAAMTTIFIILSTTGEASADETQRLPIFCSMDEWCSKTHFPDLCNSLTRTLKNGTEEQAARLVLLGAQEKLKEGITRIDSAILNNTSPDILIKKRLESCREDYNRTLHGLDEPLKMTKDLVVFPNKYDWFTLMGSVKVLEGLTSPCDEQFKETVTNPVKGISDQFNKMVSMIRDFGGSKDLEGVEPDPDA